MSDDINTPSSPLPPGPGAPTAADVLNRMFLELSKDLEIAPYLSYVIVPIQLVPAEKTVQYIERVIAAFRRAKGETE